MDVKNVVADRLERARSFAESVRGVYEKAYRHATEMRKEGISELVRGIQPRVQAAVKEGVDEARSILDGVNQSLADKAIPTFRKGAVSKEQLEQKSKQAQLQPKTKSVSESTKKPSATRKKSTKKTPVKK